MSQDKRNSMKWHESPDVLSFRCFIQFNGKLKEWWFETMGPTAPHNFKEEDRGSIITMVEERHYIDLKSQYEKQLISLERFKNLELSNLRNKRDEEITALQAREAALIEIIKEQREALESMVDKYFDLPVGKRMQTGLIESNSSLKARAVLTATTEKLKGMGVIG